MVKRFSRFVLPLSLAICGSAMAGDFKLISSEIADGRAMTKDQEFKGFGCDGGNRSPQLSWSGAPEATKAYALFVYDPDAPTGSGWWHWQLINIPKDVTSLAAGAGEPSGKAAPAGSLSMKNDYGIAGFGGACPPQGNGVHHYQFTLYALSKTLDLPEDASGALTGYMVRANSLGSASIEALYKRD